MADALKGPLPALDASVQLAYLQDRVEFVQRAMAVPGVALATQQLATELHILLSITESVKFARDNAYLTEPKL